MTRWIRTAAVVLLVLIAGSLALAWRGGLTLGRFPGAPGSASNGGGAPAPEFTGIDAWLNSPPLTMRGLRGRVVLVDFWTYSCVNCIRTLPFVHQWWDRYRADGLVIVGVHSPEFEFEKNISNIRGALSRYDITWPVAVDSEHRTWDAYLNQYWPADYLIDRQGRIRYTSFGEGDYDSTENAIRKLLQEAGVALPQGLASADPGLTSDAATQTDELYAGSDRSDGSITLSGQWQQLPEYAEHERDAADGEDTASIEYQARRVFMVAQAPVACHLWLRLDGHELATSDAAQGVQFDGAGHAFALIQNAQLYPLISRPDFAAHRLTISPDCRGFRLYTFTFGS